MLKKLFSLVVAAAFGQPSTIHRRAFTRDVAFPYRMGAGFPGDVNRTHPMSIEPALIDVDDYPTGYGQAVLVDATTHGVKHMVSGDSSVTKIYGVTVRPYPIQQQSGGPSASFGSATPPVTGVIDLLRAGYIMVSIPPSQAAAAVKGGAVFVRLASATGDQVLYGFETAADGGNTAALDTNKYTFNGGADANGNVELCVNV
jgi:hypothetical protein